MRAYNFRSLLLSCATFTAASLLLPAAVQAQDETQTMGVETVVVTARLKTENFVDVPVAGTVLSAADLERYASNNLQSIAQQIPQVSITEQFAGNGAIIAVRGVGSSTLDGGISQEVTVNVDGVPISRGRIVTAAFIDQSSVEVLKGPQALYFGKNAPAGVIVVNSKNPGSVFEGYGRAAYENSAEEYSFEGGVSIPITDDLSMRVSARYSDQLGGWIDNVAQPITDPALLPAALASRGITLPGAPYKNSPQAEDIFGRLTLDYHPSDSFTAVLKVLVTRHEDNGFTGLRLITSCGPGQAGPNSVDTGGGGVRRTDPYASCNGLPTLTNSEGTIPAEVAAHYPGSNGGIPFTTTPSYLSSLTMTDKLTDNLTLVSVSGYYGYNVHSFSNADSTVFAMATGVNGELWNQWSQELHLESSFDFPVNFTVGGFFQRDKRVWHVGSLIAYYGPDPANGRWDTNETYSTYDGRTISLFGALNWKITPDIELSGGVRYTNETQDGDLANIYVRPQYVASLYPQGQHIIGTLAQNNASPEATLSWHPTENVMVYGAYRTGFKSGGFSSSSRYAKSATPQNQQFRNETVQGYEGGLKFGFEQISGDLTAYNYFFKGLQLSSFDTVSSQYITQNAASAFSRGIELNINYVPVDGLTLRGALGLNKARYGSFPDSQCYTGQTAPQGCVGGVQDLSGRPLAMSPNVNASVGFTYNRDIGDGFNLSVSSDVRYSSGYPLYTTLNPLSYQDDYAAVDATASLSYEDWQFSIIGRNLSDTIYLVSGADKPLGSAGQTIGLIGRPRSIIFQLTRDF